MSPLWRFLHFAAMTAWIGGGTAVIIAQLAANKLDRSFHGGIAEVQGAIYRTMVGPGAMIATVSGLMLTFKMYGALSVSVGAWLGTMQALGVIAALVSLLGAMPAATKLSRMEPIGEGAKLFDHLQKRLLINGTAGTILATIAMLAGALYRG